MSDSPHTLPGTTGTAQSLILPPETVTKLRAALPGLAQTTVDTIMDEVPSYQVPLKGAMGQNIKNAVALAFINFLKLADDPDSQDPTTPLTESTSIAYDLGRGEARSGRSMEALMAAFRIGARCSWRGISQVAAESGLTALAMGRFAELLFAYIDELTAASLAGHTDELATSGRVRQRYLERLTVALVTADADAKVAEYADRLQWSLPDHVVVMIAQAATASGVVSRCDAGTAHVSGDLVGLTADHTVIVTPAVRVDDRNRLVTLAGNRPVIIGPRRPTSKAHESFARAYRALHHNLGNTTGLVDTETLLTELLTLADPSCFVDLQARALAPLDGMSPAQRGRLMHTLQAWVQCQGHRDAMAEKLFVHPQTVRYRMTKVRELYGDALDDPAVITELTLALCAAPLDLDASAEDSAQE